MHSMSRTALLTLSLALSPLALAASLKDVAPYPEAEQGYTRHVIHLPPQANEHDHQLEVLASKRAQTDCNTRHFSGHLQEHTLQGWGYPYYRLDAVNGPLSTMMACPDKSKKEAQVPIAGDGFKLRYNSKLPVVVYAPVGVEVRYRIWSASEEVQTATVE